MRSSRLIGRHIRRVPCVRCRAECRQQDTVHRLQDIIHLGHRICPPRLHTISVLDHPLPPPLRRHITITRARVLFLPPIPRLRQHTLQRARSTPQRALGTVLQARPTRPPVPSTRPLAPSTHRRRLTIRLPVQSIRPLVRAIRQPVLVTRQPVLGTLLQVPSILQLVHDTLLPAPSTPPLLLATLRRVHNIRRRPPPILRARPRHLRDIPQLLRRILLPRPNIHRPPRSIVLPLPSGRQPILHKPLARITLARDITLARRGSDGQQNWATCFAEFYFRPQQCIIILCISMGHVRLYPLTHVHIAEVFDNVQAAFRLFIKEEGQKDKKLE